MLPRQLCENLCSLNPGEDRLTYTVEWTMDQVFTSNIISKDYTVN